MFEDNTKSRAKKMISTIKIIFKPSLPKIIIFLVLFLIMFLVVPFVNSSTSQGTKSLYWLLKNYSGQKQVLSIILAGAIIYLLVSYFISCLVFSLKNDLKNKK